MENQNTTLSEQFQYQISVVDFTKSCKSKISRKCEFQPIKSLEITLTITLTINLRLTTFCVIDLRTVERGKIDTPNTHIPDRILSTFVAW